MEDPTTNILSAYEIDYDSVAKEYQSMLKTLVSCQKVLRMMMTKSVKNMVK